MPEKVGDILYRVEWDEGFGPWHPLWDETCTHEDDACGVSIKMETWRIRSIQRRRRSKTSMRVATITGVNDNSPKYVFAQRFDHGHSVTMKTKSGKIVSYKWNDWAERWDKKNWKTGERPNAFRPTKTGAISAAISTIRKHRNYKNCSNQFDGMIKRLKTMKSKLQLTAN